MSHRTLFPGYSIRNYKESKGPKTIAYSGELVNAESGKLICSFNQTGFGFPTGVHWEPGTDEERHQLAMTALSRHNDDARENGEAIVTRSEVEKNPERKNRFSEYGIELACEEHKMNLYFQKHCATMIFARTNKDRIVEVKGTYDPRQKALLREQITDKLPDGEEVLEIINERYIN